MTGDMVALSGDDLPELARPAVGLSQAQREQTDIQPWESGLLDIARVHHPTVKWWHGYRKSRERFGSYCYICEAFTVTWDRMITIPPEAVDAIDRHKHGHRAGTAQVNSRTGKG